jgi:type VI secretion system protein ImpE
LIRPQASSSATVLRAAFRYADDLISSSFEVMIATGKYFRIPVETVVSLKRHTLRRPRDLFWRRCSMLVRNGAEGDVYLPAVYNTDGAVNDGHRLGGATEGMDSVPVRGSGQRVFLVGEEGLVIHELGTVAFV